ncbi:nucleoside-diphosphate-sugar epimerase [Tenacibaculum adriaticum]|uniref:Nucleoside-diphosphate-sugar epimerase n=1 Tax=Tenacibaculum adriaticum TaxID=413713 RepID=A0A5S5DK20_9FLAO|nr:dTDP-glucose 4,6-dehydratase [Tenacibaculum adriaticum]TYP96261.1 nucleoside-diphosphate-sugar epimerase [Tenacibaculum adriaticum]
MKTYSILGCGWLGLPLATQFISKGICIKGSSTSVDKLEKLKKYKITSYLVDIEKEGDYQEFLDAEVLIIAITSKDINAYEYLVSQIEKASVKKVVFISSTSVYPSLNKVITEEDDTIDSLLAKVENIFRNNTNFKTTIIRFAGLFGGDRKPGNWFRNKKVPHPKGYVNMIHREDCIAIIEKIIKQDVWNETFNACSNHHPTREAFYTNAKKSIGMEPPVFDDSQPLKYKIISPKKLETRLGYRFKHNDLLNI